MTREAIPLVVPDIGTFARALGRSLVERHADKPTTPATSSCSTCSPALPATAATRDCAPHHACRLRSPRWMPLRLPRR
jgi:hypothetical protein